MLVVDIIHNNYYSWLLTETREEMIEQCARRGYGVDYLVTYFMYLLWLWAFAVCGVVVHRMTCMPPEQQQ